MTSIKQFCRGIALSLAVAASSSLGQAAGPDFTLGYRFLPRRSFLDELHVGTEQPDLRYQVYGTFDVAYSRVSDDPWIGQAAAFVNVEALVQNPFSAAPPRSLDEILNLSELEGRQLPVAAPFDVYGFTGTTKDGNDVRLRANVIGSWFYLYGDTTLPKGRTAGVEYHLEAVARKRPFADFNDDDVVDGRDIGVLTNYFGYAGSSPEDATSLGDADGDQDVDGADALAWQRLLGEKSPGVLATELAATGPAPEPSSLILALVGGGVSRRRRRLALRDRSVQH